MKLRLEELGYQQEAIKSVLSVFEGQEKNTIDNACSENIRTNVLSLTEGDLLRNIRGVSIENGIEERNASFQKASDLCIEMETGTGKNACVYKDDPWIT